jgi:hypothetical protein
MANLFTQQTFDFSVSNMESNAAFGSFLVCTFARDTVVVKNGLGSCKVTWPAPSGATPSWVNHTAVGGLTVGQKYRVSAWVWVPAGMPDICGYVAFTNTGPAMSVKNAWVRYSYDFTATSTSHFCGWGTVAAPTAGVGMWLDDISLDVAGVNDGVWGPPGSPSGGPLPRPLVGPTENLLLQRDFETDIRFIESNLALNTKISCSFAQDSTRPHNGTKALKVSWPAGDGTKGSWINNFFTDYRGKVGCTPGRQYRFTAWVWVPSGAPDVQAVCLFNSLGPVISTKDAWVLVDHVFTATGAGHLLGIGTVGPTSAYADAMWTDTWRVQGLDNDGAWGSGDLPAPIDCAWTGLDLWNFGTLDAALPALTSDWLGRVLLYQILTLDGWKSLVRVKWPTP